MKNKNLNRLFSFVLLKNYVRNVRRMNLSVKFSVQ